MCWLQFDVYVVSNENAAYLLNPLREEGNVMQTLQQKYTSYNSCFQFLLLK